MTTTMYRPTALPPSILDEIVCDDFERRQLACEAVCATVWGHGLQMCRTPAERAAWLIRYSRYLERMSLAWSTTKRQPRLTGTSGQNTAARPPATEE